MRDDDDHFVEEEEVGNQRDSIHLDSVAVVEARDLIAHGMASQRRLGRHEADEDTLLLQLPLAAAAAAAAAASVTSLVVTDEADSAHAAVQASKPQERALERVCNVELSAEASDQLEQEDHRSSAKTTTTTTQQQLNCDGELALESATLVRHHNMARELELLDTATTVNNDHQQQQPQQEITLTLDAHEHESDEASERLKPLDSLPAQLALAHQRHLISGADESDTMLIADKQQQQQQQQQVSPTECNDEAALECRAMDVQTTTTAAQLLAAPVEQHLTDEVNEAETLAAGADELPRQQCGEQQQPSGDEQEIAAAVAVWPAPAEFATATQHEQPSEDQESLADDDGERRQRSEYADSLDGDDKNPPDEEDDDEDRPTLETVVPFGHAIISSPDDDDDEEAADTSIGQQLDLATDTLVANEDARMALAEKKALEMQHGMGAQEDVEEDDDESVQSMMDDNEVEQQQLGINADDEHENDDDDDDDDDDAHTFVFYDDNEAEKREAAAATTSSRCSSVREDEQQPTTTMAQVLASGAEHSVELTDAEEMTSDDMTADVVCVTAVSEQQQQPQPQEHDEDGVAASITRTVVCMERVESLAADLEEESENNSQQERLAAVVETTVTTPDDLQLQLEEEATVGEQRLLNWLNYPQSGDLVDGEEMIDDDDDERHESAITSPISLLNNAVIGEDESRKFLFLCNFSTRKFVKIVI